MFPKQSLVIPELLQSYINICSLMKNEPEKITQILNNGIHKLCNKLPLYTKTYNVYYVNLSTFCSQLCLMFSLLNYFVHDC